MSHHATWLDSIVNVKSMRITVRRLASMIHADKSSGMRIDAIAVRGISGAVIGGALSLRTGIPLVIVRKAGDGSHSSHMVEYDDEFSSYVIVDDLISSGKTVDAMINAIGMDETLKDSRCIKIYLYHDDMTSYHGIKVESFYG